MLRTRVVTALLLVLAVVAALFVLPPPAFTGLIAIVILGVGGWEAARLGGLESPAARVGFSLLLLSLGAGAIWLLHAPSGPGLLFGAAAAGWLLLLAWLLNYEFGRAGSDRTQPVKLIAAMAILLPAFAALSWVHFQSPWLVLLPVVVIAAADIGAYFTGRGLGGPKLAPRISPGKTWSGAAGGMICGALAAALVCSVLPDVPFGPAVAAAAGLVLAGVSIGGDLLVSLFKRHRGLKDTSGLLPGHGGLLDRIDSLSAALPFYALLLWFNLP